MYRRPRGKPVFVARGQPAEIARRADDEHADGPFGDQPLPPVGHSRHDLVDPLEPLGVGIQVVQKDRVQHQSKDLGGGRISAIPRAFPIAGARAVARRHDQYPVGSQVYGRSQRDCPGAGYRHHTTRPPRSGRERTAESPPRPSRARRPVASRRRDASCVPTSGISGAACTKVTVRPDPYDVADTATAVRRPREMLSAIPAGFRARRRVRSSGAVSTSPRTRGASLDPPLPRLTMRP